MLSKHYDRVILEWQALLADQSATEPAYLRFLRDHAGFFFCDSQRRLVAISELQFGADYRSDFVVGIDEASYGFTYELIELESPHDIVYTKSGQPSAKLTEAINQIHHWQLWLDANRSEAKRILPSKQFGSRDKPNFVFLIIIGRRDNNSNYSHMRNFYADSLRVQIRSFDYLTDLLKARYFYSLPFYASVEMNDLHPSVRNHLVNPFARAFSSGDWRGVANSFRLGSTHMIANNAEVLIDKMQHNGNLDLFLRDWEALPLHEKEKYWEAIEFLLRVF